MWPTSRPRPKHMNSVVWQLNAIFCLRDPNHWDYRILIMALIRELAYIGPTVSRQC